MKTETGMGSDGSNLRDRPGLRRLAIGITLACAGVVHGMAVDLSGKVVGKSGAPVPRCRVGLVSTPGLSVFTVSDGSFRLTGATELRIPVPSGSASPAQPAGFSVSLGAGSAPIDGQGRDGLGRSLERTPGGTSAAGAYLLPAPSRAPLSKTTASQDTLVIDCPEFPVKKVAVSAAGGDMGNLQVSKPNIIYILADDLGWFELNSYGNNFNETPNLDRLARQGVRFTNAYASGSVCSPTRGSFNTGQYPARVGIVHFLSPSDDIHLDTAHITVAERLRAAGYRTGMIGKWHLTGYASDGHAYYGPDRHGFEEVISSETQYIGPGDYWFPYGWNPNLPRVLPDSEYQVDRFNAQAVDFIARHKQETFFLMLSHMAVHTKLDAKPALAAKYAAKPGAGGENNPLLAGMIESIDQGIGRILDTLQALGLRENTLVVFNSDNGGPLDVGGNGPLRKGKGWLYEGGIREPLIASWPGVVAQGAVCDRPVITADMYPTFLAASRTAPAPAQVLDGVSFFGQLRDPAAAAPARDLYWHYPTLGPILGAPSAGAMRRGDWKLVQFFAERRQELYNLKDDLGEQTDLSAAQPAKAAELKAALAAWRESVHALMYPGQGVD